ncbi:MAG: hypothetical protein SXQ77_08340 [Halobacteria archaeon]|nr:hypothetical protein [Halobacteria archaeon]
MKLDSALIEEYLDYYSETQGVLPEKLDKFGSTFREQGYLTRDQLYDIAYESSTRSAYHVRDNPAERCENVTRKVLEIEEDEEDRDDFSQIALISALKGFKAPTASCVTTALNPKRHAVVDTRVWASLERFGYLNGRKETFDADDYCTMIRHIRSIADELGYSAAEVGYALFAYDDDVREGTLH